MSKKVKKIMSLPKEERETELRKYLISLGGSTTRTSNEQGGLIEDIVISRIINLERSHREERLWKIAVCSTIISLIAVLAAWYAAMR